MLLFEKSLMNTCMMLSLPLLFTVNKYTSANATLMMMIGCACLNLSRVPQTHLYFISFGVTCSAQRKDDEPVVEELEKEIAELVKTIETLNHTQAALNDDIRVLKGKTNEASEVLSSEKLKFSALESEVSSLEKDVVESPEAVMRLIADLRSASDLDRKEAFDAEKQVRLLASKVEILRKCLKDVKKVGVLLGDAEKEMERYREVRAETKENVSTTAALREEIDEMKTKKRHIQRQIDAANERLERLGKQEEAKRNALHGALEDQKQDLESLRLSVGKAENRRSRNAEMMGTLERQIADLKRRHDDEVARLKGEFKDIELEAKEYNARLCAAMADAQE
jgi:chromosome segregation ATPase